MSSRRSTPDEEFVDDDDEIINAEAGADEVEDMTPAPDVPEDEGDDVVRARPVCCFKLLFVALLSVPCPSALLARLLGATARLAHSKPKNPCALPHPHAAAAGAAARREEGDRAPGARAPAPAGAAEEGGA